MAALSRPRLPVWAQDLLLAVFVAFMQVQGTQRIATQEEFDQLSPVGVYAHAVLLVLSGLILAAAPILYFAWPLAVLCFAFGSARDPCVAFAAVLVLAALMLMGAVITRESPWLAQQSAPPATTFMPRFRSTCHSRVTKAGTEERLSVTLSTRTSTSTRSAVASAVMR